MNLSHFYFKKIRFLLEADQRSRRCRAHCTFSSHAIVFSSVVAWKWDRVSLECPRTTQISRANFSYSGRCFKLKKLNFCQMGDPLWRRLVTNGFGSLIVKLLMAIERPASSGSWTNRSLPYRSKSSQPWSNCMTASVATLSPGSNRNRSRPWDDTSATFTAPFQTCNLTGSPSLMAPIGSGGSQPSSHSILLIW